MPGTHHTCTPLQVAIPLSNPLQHREDKKSFNHTAIYTLSAKRKKKSSQHHPTEQPITGPVGKDKGTVG